MIKNHPQICLFRPEIPQNTGNIARLAAATQCRLHIITPTGFSTNDKNLRRAGLDYWPYLDLEVHESLDALLSQFEPEKVAFLSTKGEKYHSELPDNIQLLIFGQETKGLPKIYHEKFGQNFFKIPIFHQKVRSLNLANAVSIVLYQQLCRKQMPAPL
ncbi:MAG: tRNA (cytidine(34)-2'-O)-methyltransferase [Bdellovibrionota bacterium]